MRAVLLPLLGCLAIGCGSGDPAYEERAADCVTICHSQYLCDGKTDEATCSSNCTDDFQLARPSALKAYADCLASSMTSSADSSGVCGRRNLTCYIYALLPEPESATDATFVQACSRAYAACNESDYSAFDCDFSRFFSDAATSSAMGCLMSSCSDLHRCIHHTFVPTPRGEQ